MPKRTRWFLLAFLGLFLVFVLVDSQGFFDNKPWIEVPHGSHSHYLPKDCDPPLSVGQGPTTRPGPNETIDCQGRIVPITAD
jgi:hypothetical protein